MSEYQLVRQSAIAGTDRAGLTEMQRAMRSRFREKETRTQHQLWSARQKAARERRNARIEYRKNNFGRMPARGFAKAK